MRVAYYHAGTVGKAEVVAAIVAAGHVVMQRSAEYFRDAEKSVDALVVDDGVKLEGFVKAYGEKAVVSAKDFLADGTLAARETQTPTEPKPEPEKEPEGEPEPEKEPAKEPETEKETFNPDKPAKARSKRKQG